MVHSWKALLSGFHYHFWPILGLILQDANREEEEAVVSTLKGSKLHTTKVSDGWLCLFSGTLDFVIKLESESYKMQYYNNKILHSCIRCTNVLLHKAHLPSAPTGASACHCQS